VNIDKEIEDIDRTIAQAKEEIRQAEIRLASMRRGRTCTSKQEDYRTIELEDVSAALSKASNTLSAKSMDINVQLENVRQ